MLKSLFTGQSRRLVRHKVSYRPLSLLSSAESHAPSSDSAIDIIQSCYDLRNGVQELNDRFKGPLDQKNAKNTMLPFVFLLGNHSSGKSSFINYVLNRKVQVAGVAPTDDNFTIIAPGRDDQDRDGPALIGDPEMGFSGLRTFGPDLIHHTQLKVRKDVAIKDFMIIDTPGMIDSPAMLNSSIASNMERGYDFEKVVKWYAARADLVLLFFDPEKPGTTGETLSTLTNALSGMDHKLHIILNKADQFRKIHDFARAYGSVCWNLSKVIPRKDLPRIYTMCLPSSYRSKGSPNDDSPEGESLGSGIGDLEDTREEVVSEVLKAPLRRVDNEIQRLSDSMHLLHMHCRIVDEMVRRYRSHLWSFRATCGGAVVLAGGCSSAAVFVLPVNMGVGITAMSVLACTGLLWFQKKVLLDEANTVTSEGYVHSIFRSVYAKQLAENDEFIASMWPRVASHINLTLSASEIGSLNRVGNSDMKKIENILDVEIAKLRKKILPKF